MVRDEVIRLADGRALAFAEFGDPRGVPILFFHGNPMSRLFCPDEAATAAARVRLITLDRPGFGRSDLKPSRTVAEWADDVGALAQALDIARFTVVGVSAGGKYAAACAARMPSRLTGVAVVSGAFGPLGEQPGALERLSSQSRQLYELAQTDPWRAATTATEQLEARARQLADHPERLLNDDTRLSDADRWFLTDPRRVGFDRSVSEAVQQGALGWAWERIAALRPWGFRLEESPIEVHLWHGAHDPEESQADVGWWASKIPLGRVMLWPDAGHYAFVKHWADVLDALLAIRPASQ